MQIMIRVCLICSKTNPDERHLCRNVTQESGFFQLDGHKDQVSLLYPFSGPKGLDIQSINSAIGA